MRSLVAISLVFTVACASSDAPAPQAAPSASAPAFDLKAALARELPDMNKRVFTDATFSFEAEAVGDAVFSDIPGGRQVRFPIGSEANVLCFVSEGRLDIGAAFHSIDNATRKLPNVTIDAVELGDITVVDGRPLVEFSMFYGQASPAGKLAGVFKVWFMSRDDKSFYCAHDELGYRQTLARISEQVARSFKTSAPNPLGEPTRTEVVLMSLNDKLVGLIESREFTTGKTGTMEMDIELMFMPRTANEYVVNDGATVATYDLKDELIKKRAIQSVNGEEETDLTLTRTKGAGYHYDGTFKSKKLVGDIKSTKVLTGWNTRRADILKNLLTGKKPALSFESWSSDQDPTTLSTEIFSKDADGERRLKVKAGEMSYTLALDQKGDIEQLELPLGRFSLRAKRVFVNQK